ncbi:BA14K family protein [Sphingomonas flavalba]|uniref:BA14K family protein n=1 Tax=Sphingomonas flavalba TaxID=2559804 RepID=UPI0039DF9959
MRCHFLGVIGVFLLAAAPAVGAAQGNPASQDRHERSDRDRALDRKPAQQPAAQNRRGSPQADQKYGAWSSSWGARPPAPPKHWTKASDWHRHVRACQQRYRSYNARTDSYRARSGKAVRCRL